MSEMKLKTNGIAHIALSVRDIRKSKIFYKDLLPYLGLKLVHESSKSCYHVGGRTGILIQQINTNKDYNCFSQNNVGLHHFCFRLSSTKEIDKLSEKLIIMKAHIVRGPLHGPWVPGYYYILFEDPDNIRLEANYVPNKGVFEEKVTFNPAKDY